MTNQPPATPGSAAERVITEWRDILDRASSFRASIYTTTPELRDSLTELARVGDRLPALLAAVDKALAALERLTPAAECCVSLLPVFGGDRAAQDRLEESCNMGRAALSELRALQQQMK